MRTRYEVYKENARLRKVVVVLGAFALTMVIVVAWLVSNEIDNRIKNAYDFGYSRGFDSCIEENNLYDRYPSYKGDGQWEN